jgi:uncharacterized protein YjdB
MIQFKRYTKMLICSAGLLSAALLTACGSGDQNRDPILGLPSATLVSVAVTPATASIAVGAVQQLTATAVYTDGSARDVTTKAAWTSAAPAIATVNAAGVATGASAGTAVVTASFESKSGTASITVLSAKLVAIAVQPATFSVNIGKTLQYTVIGSFDNNTTRDITAASTFAATTPAIATITAAGLATGRTQGTTTIVATSGGLSANASLAVLPATVVSLALTPATTTFQIGATRQLSVAATYSDGNIVDVTASSTFVSGTPAAVSVSNTGLMTGVAPGTSSLTASFGGNTTNAVQATVTSATITSIAVTPATATVVVGATRQFTATATYSDNTTAVITTTAAWTSSNTTVATVLNTGVATGLTAGTATITATAGTQSASGALTVTMPVIAPVPANPVDLGRAARFAVLAGTSLTNNSGGTTLITGDVGSPSQTTAPTVAPGYTNFQTGAELNDGLADLQVAITDAKSRSCDVTFAGNVDLGGLTLRPGVYCYAGAISVTGTLNLDGAGVYIFRTDLTLNTTANSIVALLNGATAANVNWVPVGPTTLGANSAFLGSILGQSAAITVGDNTTLLGGRVLSAAAVTLSNNQIVK